MKLRQLHFSTSISSAIFAWSSKLTVGYDSMGYSLSEPDFWRKAITRVHTLPNVHISRNSNGHNYFGSACGCSHMVGHAGGPTGIVNADMTLTLSKVKVKVMGLVKFRKFLKISLRSRSISSAVLAWSLKLIADHHSMGPSLQLVGARFSIFLLRKLSCEFKLCGMSILHEFQMAISVLLEARVTWSGTLVVGCCDRHS